MGKSKFIRNPFTFANTKRGDKHLRLVFISCPIALPLSSKKGKAIYSYFFSQKEKAGSGFTFPSNRSLQ